MARAKRRPAAAEPAAKQNTAPEAGGTDAQQAEVPTKPAEDPTSPDGVGQVIAQAPGAEASPDASAGAEAQANQPKEDGAPSSVSGSDDEEDQGGDHAPGFELYVRTHGKKPRRRSGIAFGPEALRLTNDDFTRDIDGANALLAILEDPQLHCYELDEEGEEQPLVGELELETLRAAIASGLIPDSHPVSGT